MRTIASKIWTVALLLALVCIVFPPRRDTEQGRDREGIPPRQFLWAGDLYKGSRAGLEDFHLTARIDFEKLALELLALGALTGAIVAGVGCCCRSDKLS